MSEITGNIENVKGDITEIKDFTCSPETYHLLKVAKKGFGGDVDFNVAEAKKNLIALGTTGSGKTTSVLLPAIDNLIKHNNVGLILDVKSELYQDVYHIAKLHNREKDLIFIGTQDFCTPINLLASLKNEEQLRNIIAACSPSSANQENGDYWESNGVEDVMNVVSLDRWYHEYKGRVYRYNFNTLLDYIIDSKKVMRLYKDIEACEEYMPEQIANTLRKTKSDRFSLYNAAIHESDPDVQNQKTWRSGRVATVLKPFTEEPFASNLNCEENPKTIHDMVFKEGKIIVLTIPIEYESVGFTLGKLLREIYYKSVLSNSPEDRVKLKLGDEFNRYAFLLVDEYQGFVNTKSSNGVITDDTWGSISRSFENINIYATQSIRHLDNAIGETATDVIMSNCASEIILRAQDQRTLNHVALVYGKALNGDLDFLINPTSRVCVTRLEDQGRKLCFKGTMEVDDQAKFHSKEYKEGKNNSMKELVFVKKNNPKPQTGLFVASKNWGKDYITMTNGDKLNLLTMMDKYVNKTELLKSIVRKFIKKDGENFISLMTTPYNFDFSPDKRDLLAAKLEILLSSKQKIITRNYIKVMGENGFDFVLNPDLIPSNNLEDDVLFICRDDYRAWDDISSKIDIPKGKRVSIKELAKNRFKVREKVICFVMGGGNLSSDQFNFFRSVDNFWKIKKANPDSIIYTGIGHAGDSFIFDYLADKSFITPTELAEYLIKLGYKSTSKSWLDLENLD